MLIEQGSHATNRIADFIFLDRILKLNKPTLAQLFKDPTMNLQKIKNMERQSLLSLIPTKNSLDAYQIIETITHFDQQNESYQSILKMLEDCRKNNIKLYTPITDDYPTLFRSIPSVLNDIIFVKGSILDCDLKSYSICGTREPTALARTKTQMIAEAFAKNGFTLINGFAKGIDIEAYKGQRKGNGRYIGVLGSGVQEIYPAEHHIYVNEIIQNGALISQRFIYDRVNQQSLQMRNQLSAQLTRGSIFIEGTNKSGTRWQLKFCKEAKKNILYLEPEDWNHENAFICKLAKEEGGIEIKNDLSNLNEIINGF